MDKFKHQYPDRAWVWGRDCEECGERVRAWQRLWCVTTLLPCYMVQSGSSVLVNTAIWICQRCYDADQTPAQGEE